MNGTLLGVRKHPHGRTVRFDGPVAQAHRYRLHFPVCFLSFFSGHGRTEARVVERRRSRARSYSEPILGSKHFLREPTLQVARDRVEHGHWAGRQS